MQSSVREERRMLGWLLRLCLLGLAIGKTLNEELTEHLLSKKQHKNIRPVVNPRDQLIVNVIGALYQIVDVDQRNNLATISAYFDLWWHDHTMKWDPNKYNGTKQMYLPSSEVWVPELYLYHSIKGSKPITVQEWAVQVSYTGEVRIFFPFSARALCPINVKYFPFDRQHCNFIFGSWSYKLESISFVVKDSKVFLDDFYDNQEWRLINTSMKNDSTLYNTTDHQEHYSTVRMELELQREHFYYIFNLMIPTTLVTVVAIIGFHAPSTSGPRRETKFRLGIMTLLSMGVMLLMVVEEMPKFSLASIPGQRGSFSDVPILGIYYIFLIFCISICTCTTSVFVLLERHALEHPEYSAIPVYLRWLDFDCSSCFKKCRSTKDTEVMIAVETRDRQPGGSRGGTLPSETTMDKSVRFGDQGVPKQPEQPVRSPVRSPIHSTTSEQTIRPPPLHHRPSWSRRNLGFNYTSYSPDPLESLSKPLDRMADTLSVISQRLLYLQAKLNAAPASGSPPVSPTTDDADRNTKRVSRRQSAATRGQPIMTHSWNRIILRLEMISLCMYLLGITVMILLVAHRDWY